MPCMQVLLQKRYSTRSDVWSYGMLLFEIWSLGYKPFPFLIDSREVRCSLTFSNVASMSYAMQYIHAVCMQSM